MEHHLISAQHLSIDRIREILFRRLPLALSDDARARIVRCREYLDRKMENPERPVYGITTGFGSLCDISVGYDELAQLRYEASIRPGFQESFAAMFPAPRQRWVDTMASAEADIRALPHETLVIHGREDQVIPLANSLTLSRWIPNSQLHVFGHCGHWTQIEHSARFNRLVEDFLAEADAGP